MTASLPPRVAVLSYPMLFQAIGGLQIQIEETIAALRRAGTDARLVDPNREKLEHFDLLHVFAAINGNHRIVEWGRAIRKPVVLSPLVRPNWTRGFARRARLAEALAAQLTGWELKTEYRQMRSGIENAARCVALGEIERRCLIEGFEFPANRIDVVPNGIPAAFFEADGAAFRAAFPQVDRFVLCVASINEHKNQLGLARALADSDVQVVLIGQCLPSHQHYLDRLLAHPRVVYAGAMDYRNPLLPSAYAAANAFCLPSMSEVMPLSVLEALAAGTPAVMTRHHCMSPGPMDRFIAAVDPRSPEQIRRATLEFIASRPDPHECRRSVAHLTWDAVAQQLLSTYRRALVS